MAAGKNILLKGRVDHNSAEVKLTLLAKRKPDIAQYLDAIHQELMPEIVFKDYGLIPDFLTEFCSYHEINPASIAGRKISSGHMTHRKQFLAVLLLCFHPEKIIEGGITQKRTWQGLELQAALSLDCLDKSLAMQIPEVVTWYQTYAWFSEPVKEIHSLIVEKFKHRANDKQVRVFAGFTKPTVQLNIFE